EAVHHGSAMDFSVTLDINESGKVTKVYCRDDRDPDAITWVSRWLRTSWSFNPGLEGGQPVASHLAVLLRIHVMRGFDSPEVIGTKDPVTLIQVFPSQDNVRWEVNYGGLIESS